MAGINLGTNLNTSLIFIMSILVGFVLNICINQISYRILNCEIQATRGNEKFFCDFKCSIKNSTKVKIDIQFFMVILLTIVSMLISYYKIGFKIAFLKAVILNCVMIVVFFIDCKHKIIPDNVVVIALIAGFLLLFTGEMSILNAILGMLIGGSIMLFLALIPGALGGGDVKLMFVMGSYLGVYGSIKALLIAFILSGIVSSIVLLLKIKGLKDYIPFGPFLALGCYIAYNF